MMLAHVSDGLLAIRWQACGDTAGALSGMDSEATENASNAGIATAKRD